MVMLVKVDETMKSYKTMNFEEETSVLVVIR